MTREWTKIGKAVVSISMVLGLCCMLWTLHSIRPKQNELGNQEPTAQASPLSQQPTTTQLITSHTAEEMAYQEILEAYQVVLNANSKTFLETPETYFHGDHAILQMFHGNRYQEDVFFYTYYDLDGNGTQELLIGFGWDGWINENSGAAQLVDLYSFDGTKAVKMLDDSNLGVTTSTIISKDGTLLHISINSDNQTVCTYLRVDGCTVKEINTMVTDPDSIAFMEVKDGLYWWPLEKDSLK